MKKYGKRPFTNNATFLPTMCKECTNETHVHHKSVQSNLNNFSNIVAQASIAMINIFYNYNSKVVGQDRMGNSLQQKSSLMVKNWVKLDNNSYRNAITEELIDEYHLNYSTEEEMIASHSQLMSRANINHPNIIKLIYFCQNMRGCCTGKQYSHQVFIQHHHQQLTDYLRDRQNKLGECFCCSLVNAFNHLSEKYGFFRVQQSMIFLGSQAKWHKFHEKKTVKVWINSKLELTRPEQPCKQEDMCRSIYQILDRLAQCGVCDRFSYVPNNIFKIQNLLQEIYKAHNSPYQRQAEGRKRVASTFIVPNHSGKVLNTIAHQSSQDTLMIKNTRGFENFIEPDLTARNLNRTLDSQKKNDEAETTKKLPSSTTKKLNTDILIKEKPSPFYRPQNKINFAYNDLFSTPKQIKIIPTEKILNVSSPCFNLQEVTKPEVVVSKLQEQPKTPKLQRMTVNLMVENKVKKQEIASEPQEIQSPRKSEDLRKKKLQEIVESSNHIASSPFLIDVNQTNHKQESQPEPEQNIQPQTERMSQSLTDRLKECTETQNYVYDNDQHQIHVETIKDSENRYFADPKAIILCESIRDSQDAANDISYIQKLPAVPDQYLTAMQIQMAQPTDVETISKFNSMASPPMLMHTSKSSSKNMKTLPQGNEVYSNYEISPSNHSEHSKLDNNYNKYLKKFNQVINPISPRSKFSSRPPPFQSLPSQYSQANQQIPDVPVKKTYSKYNSLNLQEDGNRKKSKSKASGMEMSEGMKPKEVHSGEIESLYNQSNHSDEQNKAKIIERIENTEKIIRENRKKLEKLELEKDLQREKEIIKKEMESLLKNNLMSDESNRIKEKVKYKKATFAELKAQASKILQDFNF